ncbi:MAG TPA: choice-of-anchor Q domain-containing protein, partial [Aggregatilineales bacterium]|nr:choice-of-anchor Q domain-containing protein [Aggregatilineales bacterium]
ESGSAVFSTVAPQTITSSAFVANSSDNSQAYALEIYYAADEGGAITTENADVTLTNSTFSGNVTASGGGSVAYSNKGNLKVISSTIVNNIAAEEAPLVTDSGKLQVQQSILAGNLPADVAFEQPFESLGYNLIASDSAGRLTVQPTDQVNLSPRLAALYNGLYLLNADSPALHSIPADACATNTDQRGVKRPQGSTCDIGSVEMEVARTTPTPWPTPGPSPAINETIPCTESALRQALPRGGTLSFPANCVITLTTDLPDVGATLLVHGNHAIIDGAGAFRLFHAPAYASISLDNLTLRNGRGALQAERGGVMVADCIFINNRLPDGDGGAIFAGSGIVIVEATIFTGNSAEEGGAIYAYNGRVSITGGAFTGNTAQARGGALWMGRSSLEVSGSQFIENSTTQGDGGAIFTDSGAVMIRQSHFRRNLADFVSSDHSRFYSAASGAIYANLGDVTIIDSQFEDNVNRGSGGSSVYASKGSLRVDRSTFVGVGGQAAAVGVGPDQFSQPRDALYVNQTTFAKPNPGIAETVGCNELALDDDIRLGGSLVLTAGCTYRLTQDLPIIVEDISIEGNGAAIDGASKYRLLYAPGQVSLALDDLVLKDGYSAADGGAVSMGVRSILRINRGLLISNRAVGHGGAVFGGGSTTILNTTLTGNSARDGGAIAGDGEIDIISSTIVGNSAVTGGGLSNSIVIQQSILASNTATQGPEFMPDRENGLTSKGYNLLDADIWQQGRSQVTLDPTDIVVSGPALGAFNGLYFPLFLDSPARDVIPADRCATTEDQRAIKRPQGNGCDVGAIEMAPPK